MTGSAPRREFIRSTFLNAGASMAVLGLLEGRGFALPKSEETDIAILNAALGLEHEAIGLYADALSRDLVPTGLREYAVEFKGAHEGHRDTQVEILRERGVTAVAPHRVDPIREAAAGDAVIARFAQIIFSAPHGSQPGSHMGARFPVDGAGIATGEIPAEFDRDFMQPVDELVGAVDVHLRAALKQFREGLLGRRLGRRKDR